jgi:subfamily B ATP-binding cassette protein MsbA
MNRAGAYARLLGYVRPHWPWFLASVGGFVLYSGCQVLLADLTQLIVDTASGAAELRGGLLARAAGWLLGGRGFDAGEARLLIPLAMLAVMLLRGLGFVAGNYCLDYTAAAVIHELRCALFARLLDAPARHYDSNPGGALLAKLTYNVEQVSGAAGKAVAVILREGAFVAGLLAYMFWLDWRLSLVFVIVAPLIALIVATVSRRFRALARRIQRAMGHLTQVAAEAIAGYREVRLFGARAQQRARFAAASADNRRQQLRLALADALAPVTVQWLLGLALALLVWLALDPAVAGELSGGQFTAFLVAAAMLAKPVRQLSEVNAIVQRGIAAAESIFEEFDQPAEPDDGRHAVPRARGALEIRGLRFSYDAGGSEVLRGIDLGLEPGETLALVGRSGGGKSTLVNVLTRLYPHRHGEVLLDDVDIRAWQLDNLRSQIALVSQQVTLLNDTLYNNIAYGALAGADPARVEAAARAAHVPEFAERLPRGLHTAVGDDGVKLSGGQRQRVAIARALLKDAPLLILDEATSALDTESERHVQAALETLMRGRSTLVIAHRLSTVERADTIAVLEDGRIVERGAHATLLAAGGRYAQLYRGGLGS